jgi:hypothetical protein
MHDRRRREIASPARRPLVDAATVGPMRRHDAPTSSTAVRPADAPSRPVAAAIDDDPGAAIACASEPTRRPHDPTPVRAGDAFVRAKHRDAADPNDAAAVATRRRDR